MRDARKQPPPVRAGEIVQAKVEALPLGPDAVTRAEGYVLFAPGGIPGETVRLRVVDPGRRFGRGEILDVLEASPERVEPFCPVYLACGGCHLQHVSDDARERSKRLLLARTVEHALGSKVKVAPYARGPLRRYRDKIALALQPGRRATIEAGFYRAHTRDLVPIEDCPVQSEPATRLALGLVDALRAVGAHAFDPETGRGDVRHVLVRAGAGPDPELYGVVVVAREDRPAWLARFTEAAKALGPVGLALNVSPLRERDFVLGPETRVLWGPARYRTTIGGITYHVSPTSFFQTNAFGAAEIVKTVLEFFAPLAKKRVLDVYGGVGLVGVACAKAGARALVVEGNPASIADGRATAEGAKLTVSFRRGRAEDLVPRLEREGSRYDCVVLDPPREGCHPRVIASVGRMAPAKIAYVSCDPESLARDLAALVPHGYRVDEVVPVDMFPHAYHIESVAKLSRTS